MSPAVVENRTCWPGSRVPFFENTVAVTFVVHVPFVPQVIPGSSAMQLSATTTVWGLALTVTFESAGAVGSPSLSQAESHRAAASIRTAAAAPVRARLIV